MIADAMALAEKQLRDGTASSQVITHFLKLGSTMAKLEKEKLARDVDLVKAKTEAVQSSKHIEELYQNAMNSMKAYSGLGGDDDV